MLPDIKKASGIVKTVQVTFGGIDKRPDAADGTFSDMIEMTADKFPLAASRRHRRTVVTNLGDGGGICGFGDVFLYISGGYVMYNGWALCSSGSSLHAKVTMVVYGTKLILAETRLEINLTYPLKGRVAAVGNLPVSPAKGDAYAVGSTSLSPGAHIYVYNGSTWDDMGPVCRELERSATLSGAYFVSDTYEGEPADMNTLYAPFDDIDFQTRFKVGDAVTISGCSEQPANNQTLIIREITSNKLRFYENSFRMPDRAIYRVFEDGGLPKQDSGTDIVYQIAGYAPYAVGDCFTLPSDVSQGWYLVSEHDRGETAGCVKIYDSDDTLQATITIDPTDGYWIDPERLEDETVELRFEGERDDTSAAGYLETGTVKVSRNWPKNLTGLFADKNRLWGWEGHTLRASKLGDPANWDFFDGVSEDSWACYVHTPDEFSGGISVHGYPTFFTENRRYRIYGEQPAAYQIAEQDCHGVMKGCGKTMVVIDGILFYLSRIGVMCDSGSLPELISAAWGNLKLSNAVGGGVDRTYWIKGDRPHGGYDTMVYDIPSGIWIRDGNRNIREFATAEGKLYDLEFQSRSGNVNYYKIVCHDNTAPAWAPSAELEGAFYSELVTNEFLSGYPGGSGSYSSPTPNRKRVHRVQIRATVQSQTTLTIWIYYSTGTQKKVAELTGTGSKKSFYLPVLAERCDRFKLVFSATGDWTLDSLALETRQGSNVF